MVPARLMNQVTLWTSLPYHAPLFVLPATRCPHIPDWFRLNVG